MSSLFLVVTPDTLVDAGASDSPKGLRAFYRCLLKACAAEVRTLDLNVRNNRKQLHALIQQAIGESLLCAVTDSEAYGTDPLLVAVHQRFRFLLKGSSFSRQYYEPRLSSAEWFRANGR